MVDHEPFRRRLLGVGATVLAPTIVRFSSSMAGTIISSPQADTLAFQGRRDTEVHLIPDIGHCGALGSFAI